MLRTLLIMIALFIAPMHGFADAYKSSDVPRTSVLPDLQAPGEELVSNRCCDGNKAIAAEVSYCKLDCKALPADYLIGGKILVSEFLLPQTKYPTSLGVSVDLRPPIS